jgi:hypothetical protein
MNEKYSVNLIIWRKLGNYKDLYKHKKILFL